MHGFVLCVYAPLAESIHSFCKRKLCETYPARVNFVCMPLFYVQEYFTQIYQPKESNQSSAWIWFYVHANDLHSQSYLPENINTLCLWPKTYSQPDLISLDNCTQIQDLKSQ